MQRRSNRRAAWASAVVLAVLAVLLPGVPASGQDSDSFRIVVLPDTQNYVTSSTRSEIALSQFGWIIDDAAASRTEFVTHVGDVVQNPNNLLEWDRIEPGFDGLEDNGIPYGISPGNHDLLPDGGPVEYDNRFPTSRFADEPWFGASHSAEGNRSSWQQRSVPGHDLLLVHLRHLVGDEADVDAVLSWFDDVLGAHPDHLAIVTTHEFTEGDGSVRIPKLQSAIAQRCTVALVLSGHRPGEAARGSFTDACGRTVHHVLTNYQFLDNGGDGFLRTLDIDPITLDTLSTVYSPWLETTRTGADEAFTITLSKLEPVGGDADCDRDLSVIDALVIVQFTVGNRTNHGSCPLPAPTQQLNAGVADVDSSGTVDVVDALLVAQCEVGIPNQLCP